jgi:Ala-tRNA(Pro) deacylase
MMTAQPLLNFHPLANTATTAIRPDDLLGFIRSCGHTPRIIDL